MFRGTYAHHQEVKIALHSLWYHHIYRCDDTNDNNAHSSFYILLDSKIPMMSYRLLLDRIGAAS